MGGEQKCDERFGGLCCNRIIRDVSGQPIGLHLKGSSNTKIYLVDDKKIRPAFVNAVMKLWVS